MKKWKTKFPINIWTVYGIWSIDLDSMVFSLVFTWTGESGKKSTAPHPKQDPIQSKQAAVHTKVMDSPNSLLYTQN